MGHVGSNEDKIAWAVVGDSITDKPLTMAVEDQRQFILRVVMPEEGELRILALNCDKGRLAGHNIFEIRLQAAIISRLAEILEKSPISRQPNTYTSKSMR